MKRVLSIPACKITSSSEQHKRERERERERERLVNILQICYERDTFHGARQPDVKKKKLKIKQ